MRIVLQRVARASVRVRDELVAEIGPGLLLLVASGKDDTENEPERLAKKVHDLRIFEDDAGKMNRSIADVDGEILVVPQFTLYGDCRKGRRPSFIDAAPAAVSEPLYEAFAGRLAESGVRTARGVFGAQMKVRLLNDGPVTVIVEKDATDP